VTSPYAGYRQEQCRPRSSAETYFAARFEVDSWRWAGVLVIRAGKGLAATVTEAVVEFLRPPRLLFSDEDLAPGPNRLYFRSKPEDRIVLSMQSKRPGPEIVSESVDLTLDYGDNRAETQEAYERLLRDALEGDQSLFARVDGVMEAWRVVEPVLDNPPEPFAYERETQPIRPMCVVRLDLAHRLRPGVYRRLETVDEL
jgi:glucose-6-phosphate 1-dehydrogenase